MSRRRLLLLAVAVPAAVVAIALAALWAALAAIARAEENQ